jgi:hypothetical protein
MISLLGRYRSEADLSYENVGIDDRRLGFGATSKTRLCELLIVQPFKPKLFRSKEQINHCFKLC